MSSSYSRPSECGSSLRGEDLEVAVDRAAGEVRGALAAAVEHQHARVERYGAAR